MHRKHDFGIYIYNFDTKKWKPVLYGHTYFPSAVAFTNDSKYLISTSEDNQTILWDANKGKRVLTIVTYDLSTVKNQPATKNISYIRLMENMTDTSKAIERR